MNNKLILMNNKEIIGQFLTMFPMIIGVSGLYYIVAGGLNIPLISPLLRYLIVLFLIIMIITVLYGLWIRNDDQPVAILDEKGIWMSRHGLIYWDEIKDVVIYHGPSPEIRLVGIWLNDPANISRQSTFSGKMELFWPKIFSYPHITISNITTDVDEVVRFAQSHLSKRI